MTTTRHPDELFFRRGFVAVFAWRRSAAFAAFSRRWAGAMSDKFLELFARQRAVAVFVDAIEKFVRIGFGPIALLACGTA